MTIISEQYRDKFRAASAYGEKQWQLVAKTCREAMDDAKAEGIKLAKMELYSIAASDCGVRSGAVRGWCRVFNAADGLLEDYPFCFSHWRELCAAARRDEVDLKDLADTYAEEADEFGGQIIPPDVLRTRLHGKKLTGSKYDRALHALEGAIRAVKKNATTSIQKGNADRMLKAWEETYGET